MHLVGYLYEDMKKSVVAFHNFAVSKNKRVTCMIPHINEQGDGRCRNYN